MEHRNFKDDDFLCENCGYVLTGMIQLPCCPECGQPIEQSHPDHRTGSPWQNNSKHLPTVHAILLHPGQTFAKARIETESARAFKHLIIAATGLFTGFIVVGIMLTSRIVDASSITSQSRFMTTIAIANAAMLGIPISLILETLTAIEYRGIRLFGAVHKRRISPEVAQTIVGHASAAWLSLPVLLPVFWLLGRATQAIAIRNDWAMWELTLTAPYWMPWLAALFSMLWFELIVWTGVRKLRYANSPKVLEQRQATTATAN